MAILNQSNLYASGESVTASNLNALIGQATFKTGNGEAVDGSTLQVHSTDGYIMVKDGGISSTKLAAGAVNASAIGSGAITATQLATDSVTATQLANDAVTTSKIKDSTGASDGVTTAKLATGAVTTAKLADGAVTAAKISATDSTFNVDSVNGAVGIGIAHEDTYALKVSKLKIEADAAQIWFKDANETSSPGPDECAFSLNERAMRVGFTGESVASFAVFRNTLSIPGATVTNMPSAAADGALEGNISFVINGNSGSPCLAVYIGTAGSGGSWRVLATPGSAISA